MTLKLLSLRDISPTQAQLTRQLVDKLRATDEKWHCFGTNVYDGTCYQSIGIGLRLAGVPVLTELEARLKWDKLCACFDIDFDTTSHQTEFFKLYGWYEIVMSGDDTKGWHERGLCWLDCRMNLTFSKIAGIIEGALEGYNSIEL